MMFAQGIGTCLPALAAQTGTQASHVAVNTSP